jgi:hypothetical protein
VTFATAAAPVRLVATVLAVVSFLAFLAVGRADGAQRSAATYLAPEAACASASDANAVPAVQARAIACLVNWARAQDRRSRLVPRSALQIAAALKGERVAACGQFSHTPCGTAVTSAVQASGYRYATFGESSRPWGQVSARDRGVARLAAASRESSRSPLPRHWRCPNTCERTVRDGDAVVWAG